MKRKDIDPIIIRMQRVQIIWNICFIVYLSISPFNGCLMSMKKIFFFCKWPSHDTKANKKHTILFVWWTWTSCMRSKQNKNDCIYCDCDGNKSKQTLNIHQRSHKTIVAVLLSTVSVLCSAHASVYVRSVHFIAFAFHFIYLHINNILIIYICDFAEIIPFDVVNCNAVRR